MDERDFPPMPQLYVVVRYDTDRRYGGPEEGGWWYTEGEVNKIVLATRDQERAWEATRELNDARPNMRREFVAYYTVELPRRQLTLAADRQAEYDYDFEPEAKDYEVRWDIPAYFPEHRPHYS